MNADDVILSPTSLMICRTMKVQTLPPYHSFLHYLTSSFRSNFSYPPFSRYLPFLLSLAYHFFYSLLSLLSKSPNLLVLLLTTHYSPLTTLPPLPTRHSTHRRKRRRNNSLRSHALTDIRFRMPVRLSLKSALVVLLFLFLVLVLFLAARGFGRVADFLAFGCCRCDCYGRC